MENKNNTSFNPTDNEGSQQIEKNKNPKILQVINNLTSKKKAHHLLSKLGMNQTFLQEVREEKSLSDEKFMKKRFPNFSIAKTFGPGESFGEIALMANKGRSATIVLKEDTHFMSLSKEAFNKVFSIYKTKIFDQQIQFLYNFSFLRDLSNYAILQLLYNLSVKIYSYKQIIFREKDCSEYIYLIKRGEVEISKNYTLKEQFEHHYYPNQNTNRKTKGQLINKEGCIVQEKYIEEGAFQQNMNLRRENKIAKRIVISKLGPNSYFGEHEIVSHAQFRETQAICSSFSSEVYIIEKEKLKSVLSATDYQLLVNENKEKVSYQSKRVQQSIDLKENKKTNIFSLGQIHRPENEFQLNHNLESLKKKMSNPRITEQTDYPQKTEHSQCGVITRTERDSTRYTSRVIIDTLTNIPLTPKALFPIKKKCFLLDAKTTEKDTETKLEQQQKPRQSVERFPQSISSLTHIGEVETAAVAYKQPIWQFSSSLAYISETNQQTNINFTSENINSKITIKALKQSQTINILPMNILSLSKAKSNESESTLTNHLTDYDQNQAFHSIEKLKRVHKKSVIRGVQFSEISHRLMQSQLIDKNKDIFKRKKLFQQQQQQQQQYEICFNSEKDIKSNMSNQYPQQQSAFTKQKLTKKVQSMKTIPLSDLIPLSTPSQVISNTDLQIRKPLLLFKNHSLQSNDIQINHKHLE